MARIIIPTYNRPDAISRLLAELLQTDNTSLPISIYDQSQNDRTLQRVQAFDGYLDIDYYGRKQYDAAIAALGTKLNIPEAIARPLVLRGEGGNRNFATLMSLDDTILSMDDDIRPFSLQPERSILDEVTLTLRSIECSAAEPVIGYAMAIQNTRGTKTPCRLTSFLEPLGQRAADIAAIKGRAIRISHLGPFTVSTVQGEFATQHSEVVLTVPFISYHEDVRAHLLSEAPIVANTNLHPAVLTDCSIGYGCYGGVTRIISEIPFPPTHFRCVDTTHASMLRKLKAGTIMHLGTDIIHQRYGGRFDSEEEASECEIGGMVLQYFITRWFSEHHTLDATAEMLRKVSFHEVQHSTLDMCSILKGKGYSPLPSVQDILRISNEVHTDLTLAADVFRVWHSVRDYFRENPIAPGHTNRKR